MKKMLLLLSAYYFTTAAIILAQYPLAKEKWSKPQVIEVIKDWGGEAHSSSISWDGKKLFFSGNRYVEKTDTGWSELKTLNNYINQHLVEAACISPNGKKLFYSWFMGSNDLYYSDWDSTTDDWGVAKSCGAGINTGEYGELGCSMPDDTTIVFLRTHTAFISHWDNIKQSWKEAENIGFVSDWGISVLPELKKFYYAGSRSDKDTANNFYLNYDIVVRYKDSTMPGGYSLPQILNISLEADSEYWAGNYIGRFEGFPVLTPDGRTMYFTANYLTGGNGYIYETHMIIDENGDSVTTSISGNKETFIPETIELFPPYPNPFNPTTQISYQLSENSNVKLTVYDTLGNEIVELYNGRQEAGRHEVTFDADKYKLSSGTYYVQLTTPTTSLVSKAVLIK